MSCIKVNFRLYKTCIINASNCDIFYPRKHGTAAENLRSTITTKFLCHGVFDLLHIGHIKHFKEAKNLGDILVVTLTPDRYVNKGPGRPAFNEKLRLEAIAALDVVDFVALNTSHTAVVPIQKLKPNFYCKGSDYKKKEIVIKKGTLIQSSHILAFKSLGIEKIDVKINCLLYTSDAADE